MGARRRWEGAQDQVLLFNAATTATVPLGVVSLYVALLLLALAGAGLHGPKPYEQLAMPSPIEQEATRTTGSH